MKQSDNILSMAAAVILAPVLSLPLAFLMIGMFFPHKVVDDWPFAEMAGALVLMVIAVPFLFFAIRNGIRRTFR